MKKEMQVVSQELAKEMAELGFEQSSMFLWCKERNGTEIGVKDRAGVARAEQRGVAIEVICAAYTVAELCDMLPNNDEKNGEYVTIKTCGGKWLAWKIQKGLYNVDSSFIVADTEADARAQMCIILRNTGLL